ncbi:ribose transport system substrate-binding protein [Deinobacterium chartae]|uniref:Ribose transport system substrate-binding protein n=1 Tax=Deinobacterium chartae TaxID=521158 RepID=A0A841HVX1_9DEIO|nr:ABC transporter substrate-binding protein [Deinobacterium chartae]MBB6096814.1 ribose transport system substrate-binding protein [Deinobacterium chartae]
MKTAARLAALTVLMSASLALGQNRGTIGVSIPSADHGWTAGVVYWANRTKSELEKKYPGMRIVVKTAKDANEQANQIQDLYTVNRINTLVILPVESAPLTKPVADLKRRGVYTVVVDRGLTDPSAQDAYVAGDNPGLGRVSAEYLGKAMGGKGNLVVLRGIPTVIDNQRVDAFEAVMKSKYPNIKILDKKYANWNRDDGFKVMQDYLTRFPKIDAVWAQDDDIAVGVLRAIQQARRNDIKIVLGGAGMKEMIKRVMDGDKLITADVTYPPDMIADAMRMAAESRASGKPMPKNTIIPSKLITKENAKNFYFPDSPF